MHGLFIALVLLRQSSQVMIGVVTDIIVSIIDFVALCLEFGKGGRLIPKVAPCLPY